MARIVVRESAQKMLDTFVRERRQSVGFQAARRLRERIMNGIYRLRDYPELGRRLSEFSEANLRQLIVPPYRILYEVADDTVTILDIVHGRSVLDDESDSEP
ncbi:MAG: type II toxin-antitoxin system RelE/ParE family toxin [Thermomicrobiales bacterium]